MSSPSATHSQEISREFYEQTYYAHVESLEKALKGRLHYYKIKKVFNLYTPRKNELAVDLGSAWGAFSFQLARLCKMTVGIDFSEKAARFCTKRMKDLKIPNLAFMCADAQCTGIKDGTVDVIFSADLFEHLYPDQSAKTLDECARILRPKGKIIIWTPHRGHILEILKNNDILLKRDKAHVDYKSMKNLVDELTKRNFSVIKKYYTESHIPLWNYIEKIGMPFISLLRRRIAILAEKQK
jgi:ubiquinone/menaquinone biosynthesis C-methylase UbiE